MHSCGTKVLLRRGPSGGARVKTRAQGSALSRRGRVGHEEGRKSSRRVLFLFLCVAGFSCKVVLTSTCHDDTADSRCGSRHQSDFVLVMDFFAFRHVSGDLCTRVYSASASRSDILLEPLFPCVARKRQQRPRGNRLGTIGSGTRGGEE